MPTVQEILRQTGFSDEQIAGLDAKMITAFSGVLSTAEQQRAAAQQASSKAEEEHARAEQERAIAAQSLERAEVERRANAEWYDQTVAPALNGWGTEKANMEAQIAFFKAQNEGARAAGFIPSDAPAFTPQQRDGQGRYVAGAAGSTPGSPTFQGADDLRRDVGTALGTLADIQWKYHSLYGRPMPVSPTELVKQADALKLDPMSYAARTYDFAGKEREAAVRAQEERDSKLKLEAAAPYEQKLKDAELAAKKAVEDNDRKWAERIGSNPDVRISQPSRFADVSRAVKANERPDPLNLNPQQRRMATSQAIHSEIANQDNPAA